MPQAAPGTVVQPGAALIPTGEPYISPGTLPAGGAAGDVLSKASATDGDVVWVTPTDYLTQAEADALFLTQTEADTMFLTQAEGDARYLALGGGTVYGGIGWGSGGGSINSGHPSYLDLSGVGTIRCWAGDTAGGTQTAADISKPSISAYGYVTKSARDTKDNIRDLDVGQVDRDLMSLRAVSFTRFGQDSLGFIAEDSPDSVVVQCNDPSNTLGIDMGSVLALAVAKIQDLEARLAALEDK